MSRATIEGSEMREPLRPAFRRRRRRVALAAATLSGIAAGLLGQLVAPDPVTVKEVAGALLLSPFTVTFGGLSVSIPGVRARSGVRRRGALFGPGYVLLSKHWLEKNPRWRYLWLVFFWCAQGFFQVVARLQGIMSV